MGLLPSASTGLSPARPSRDAWPRSPFGTEAAPTVTFNRAGTFSFNITEDAAQDGRAGMSMDKHTARATVVVTDLDESGNHTGKLRVSSVTYANTGASDADKAVTDKAAFTNAYHASGTFGGVTVSKTLEGRASTAGQLPCRDGPLVQRRSDVGRRRRG